MPQASSTRRAGGKLIVRERPVRGPFLHPKSGERLKVRRVALILAQKPRYPTPRRSHSGEIARSKGATMVERYKMPGHLIRTLLVRTLFSGTSRFLCQNQPSRRNFLVQNAFHGGRADLQRALLAILQLINLRISTLLVGRCGIVSYLSR